MMNSFSIVENEPIHQSSIKDLRIHEFMHMVIDIFFLNGAVKPFEMGIVVGLPHPRMPMDHAATDDLFREPRGKLGAMVGLKRLERKGHRAPSSFHEPERTVGIDPE